jgi:hypothetical protein
MIGFTNVYHITDIIPHWEMLLAFVTCAAQNVWPTMEVSRPSQRRTSESTSLVGTKGVKGVAMQIHAGCGRKSRGSDVP